MDIDTARQRIQDIDARLTESRVVEFSRFDTPNGPLVVSMTSRLRNRLRREKKYRARAFHVALCNAALGYNPQDPVSGVDGIHPIQRTYVPANRMMTKLFDKFLDKPDPVIPTIEKHIRSKADTWWPVRLVGEQMRLLGVFAQGDPSHLVLVDFQLGS